MSQRYHQCLFTDQVKSYTEHTSDLSVGKQHHLVHQMAKCKSWYHYHGDQADIWQMHHTCEINQLCIQSDSYPLVHLVQCIKICTSVIYTSKHNKLSFTLHGVEMECSFVIPVSQNIGNRTLIGHKMCVLKD